jgi:hypothetical protein
VPSLRYTRSFIAVSLGYSFGLLQKPAPGMRNTAPNGGESILTKIKDFFIRN